MYSIYSIHTVGDFWHMLWYHNIDTTHRYILLSGKLSRVKTFAELVKFCDTGTNIRRKTYADGGNTTKFANVSTCESTVCIPVCTIVTADLMCTLFHLS